MRAFMVFVVVCGLGVTAHAKKPKVAILGLQILGVTNAESVQVAQDLTEALRGHPKAGQGPYQWTPGSEKDLLEEKTLANCANEERDCMRTIGAGLGTDYLIYGKVERKQHGGQAGYQVSLKLLNVGTAQQLASWTEFIPLAESAGPKLFGWARRAYRKLTGDYDGGALKVRILNEGFDRGTILVDGEERGTIAGGVGEVGSLPEGRYDVGVIAGGFERWDSQDKITIRNGETTAQEIKLVLATREAVETATVPTTNKKGGCAGCSTSGNDGAVAMMAIAMILLRRRASADQSLP